MLVVVPVSNHDSELAEDFCKAINFFSPYRKHKLLVVACRSAESHAKKVLDNIGNKFDLSESYFFESLSPVGWPEGPNYYFQKTIEYLDLHANDDPWFWMEMDTTPVSDSWLDLLEEEYYFFNKPCLGVLQATPTIDEHLVGVAVYPSNIKSISNMCTHVLYTDEAFDYYCRSEFVPVSARSKIIQHNFRTVRYRCSCDGMVGDELVPRRDGVIFNVPVSRQAAIVHGCNDGSLARLIVGSA